jgi:hypothetical protein
MTTIKENYSFQGNGTHTALAFAIGALLFCLEPGLAWGAPRQVLHGQVPAVVAGLPPEGRLAATNRLKLAISLPLRDGQGLTNLIGELSNPASPQYRHYLTPAEFAQRFGPSLADYQALEAFAAAHHLTVSGRHPNRLLLDVEGTVADIEAATHVTLRLYKHPTEPRSFYAPDSEPKLDLAVPVLSISGLDNYALAQPRLKIQSAGKSVSAQSALGSGPQGGYMGGDFRTAYVADSVLTGSGQVVGLLQFDGYTASDIAYYESLAHLPNVTLSNVLIDGATGQSSGTGGELEVSLDIEMSISMAPGLSRVVVYMAPNGSPFEDILSRMANDNVAKQLSCSWYVLNGAAEPSADQIILQMAVQGQTFFSASGDYDAYTGLIPFPGDTPYITQVGGTMLTTAGAGGAWSSETVWNRGDGIGSGGGISTQYPIPNWQTNINMSACQGSTSMRNTPDVALTAEQVYVRCDGQDYTVGGTSCAAPLWAGFTALVNQQAAAAGKAFVGFINPALDTIGTGPAYSSCFHDITTGNNTSPESPTKFYAVGGYDLCTGWGTPAGQKLIDALANPEALVISPASGFTSEGGAGGPFTTTSQTFLLTNWGTNVVNWSLVNPSVWLDASPAGGTLLPGGPAATVSVSLNAAASNLVVGSYNATLWFTNLSDNFGQSRQFTLEVLSPPTITMQPNDESVLDGAGAGFAVQATGGQPLSYQWQFNGSNLTDGGSIWGSTTSSLTLSNVSVGNVGAYSVVVTNLAGITVSSNALLAITPSMPVITQQPADQSVVVGASAQFTVGAVGDKPFWYQWSYNGTNLDGETNAVLALTDVQLSQAGAYAVSITNDLGEASSSNAMLSVHVVPVIASFSPASAVTGTQVTISGFGFDPTPANNTVYFGAVQAVVTSASATNLVVSVPAGATYAPITETVNGLVAYSPGVFQPRYYGNGSSISSSSFGPRLDLAASPNPCSVVMADLDGDGRPDLVVAHAGGGAGLLIYQNLSMGGVLSNGSFGTPVSLPGPGANASAYSVTVADVDGDGKLDLLVCDGQQNQLVIYRNISTGGTLTSNSFAAPVVLAVGVSPRFVRVRDLDGDGRPDIVCANYGSSTISIFRNIGSAGSLTTNSFAPRVDLAAGSGVIDVAVGDLDGDGKPDLAAVNYNVSFMSVYRNVSVYGVLNTNSFVRADLPAMGSCGYMVIGDVDGDGKPDLIAGSTDDEAIEVCRNVSTPGLLNSNSFAPGVVFGIAGRIHKIELGDIDGDGRADIGLVTEENSAFSVFQNLSEPGSFTSSSLGGRVDYASGSNPAEVAIGDLDGDGRPDVVFCNYYDNTVSVYHNVMPFGQAPTITTQPASQAAAVGGTASFSVGAQGTLPLSYQWNFNGTNLAQATNATLTLTNVQFGQAGSYAVLVSNRVGSVLSSNALLTVLGAPVIAAQPVSQSVVQGTSVSFVVGVVGTAPLSYQWSFTQTNRLKATNATLLVGATNATLALTDVELPQSGSYVVLVSNVFGSVLSSNALLTLLTPPVITGQPDSQLLMPGCAAVLSVTARAQAPMTCQWWKDGSVLTNQTNAYLPLASVRTYDFGTYQVVLSNAYGVTLSCDATLGLDHVPVTGPCSILRYPWAGTRVSTAAVLSNDTDADGDSLQVTEVTPISSGGGSVTLSNNWIYYAPPAGSSNGDTFAYTVWDGHCGGTSSGVVTVQVRGDLAPAATTHIAAPGDGSVHVSFDGIPGWNYEIQYTESLSAPNWQDLWSGQADNFGCYEFIDQAPTNAPARFYRAVSP